MKRTQFLLCAALMTIFWAGCPGKTEPITLRPPSKPAPEEGRDEQSLWKEMTPALQEDSRTKPQFISQGRARMCPKLKVSTFDGEKVEIEPGKGGYVTLVVFWSMDLSITKAAVRHVSDLAKQYGAMGVRAIGILEYPATSEHAPDFLQAQGITCPVYCDDFSALRSMGRAARQGRVKEVPCVFMVDRERRVRFFKRGFVFWASAILVEPEEGVGKAGPSQRIQREEVHENVPEGERIEDYLKRLLQER